MATIFEVIGKSKAWSESCGMYYKRQEAENRRKELKRKDKEYAEACRAENPWFEPAKWRYYIKEYQDAVIYAAKNKY